MYGTTTGATGLGGDYVGTTGRSSPGSSPSPDKFKETHTIKQGKTITGKHKFEEREKIVR